MSSAEDTSDLELDWKASKMKTARQIKQEHNASNRQKYSQKFCDKWLTIFNPWLSRCDDDANKPFCRACQCRLDCNRCHLQRHERTTKHARNLEILMNKGEGAARQNLSIRQERSKYYQQRKKLSSSQDSLDADRMEDNLDDGDSGAETSFQFVQTEAAPGDQYNEETLMKQEVITTEDRSDPLPIRSSSKGHNSARSVNVKKGVGMKKERIKMLMQIQKNKNDLLDSFKELVGGSSFQQPQPKEKNHVDLFFESVSSSVKALTPKLIAETKMRVSQLICELELRALTESEANTCNTTGSGGTMIMPPIIINPQVATVVHGGEDHSGHVHHQHHMTGNAHH